MRRIFSCQLGLLLFAAMAASAQSPAPADSGSPEITVTGRVQHPETPLPELPPAAFTIHTGGMDEIIRDCLRTEGVDALASLREPAVKATLAMLGGA